MKIVIIGGCHVSNYGVQPHLGFVQQWISQLSKNINKPVDVECLSLVKLDHIPSIISQYRTQLDEANLIVLQLGHFELCWRKQFRQFFDQQPTTSPNSVYHPANDIKIIDAVDPKTLLPIATKEKVKNVFKVFALVLYRLIWKEVPFIQYFKLNLTKRFTELVPYQNKIMVLTPFPSLNKLDNWLRDINRPFIIKTAKRLKFQVVDTYKAIPKDAFFFIQDEAHLNSLGHLAVALYLSEQRLPISAPKKNREDKLAKELLT